MVTMWVKKGEMVSEKNALGLSRQITTQKTGGKPIIML